MPDDFSPENMKRLAQRHFVRERAAHDRAMVVFRLIWDELDTGRRFALRDALQCLNSGDQLMRAVSCGLLQMPNVVTESDVAAEVLQGQDPADFSRAWLEVARLNRNVSIRPAEYLCAIACWEAGDNYIQRGPLHPSWPNADEHDWWVKHKDLWDASETAPDDSEDTPDA